jgi:hypothetical protein
MKFYRNAVILVIIVALLTGAYFLVRNNKVNQQDVQTKQYEKLSDYLSTDLESVTLENKSGTFVIVKKDGDWALSVPSDLRYDSSVLSSIVVNSASIIVDKVVEESAEDFSIYGLDDPAVATIKAKDGTSVTVEIGNQTPTGGGYYAKLKDKSKVCVISKYTGDKLLSGRNDIRTKQLFDMKTDDIKKFGLNRKGWNVFISEKADDKWNMVTPIEGDMNESSFLPMLDALVNTQVTEFVEDSAGDLSVYGLDKPAYELIFSTEAAGEMRLQIGLELKDNYTMYAKLDSVDEIFTIDASQFAFLDKPLKEIVSIFAYIVNIQDVKKIDLTMDGKTTHMELDVFLDEEGNMDSDKDKFYVNGIDASGKDENGKQPFRKFYQALIGVCIDEIDLEGDPSGGKADITIDYTLKDGTMKVEFIPKDENFYYVVRNGEYAGVLVKTRNKVDFGIEGMKQAYDTMMEFLAGQGK